MKKTLLALLALAGSAFSQAVDPFQNVLVLYDFNNLSSFTAPNTVSYCAPCVVATDLGLNGLSQSLHFFGGPDDSKFRCFAGWENACDYDFVRSDLSQAQQTLAFDMIVNPTDTVGISGLTLDWKRPSINSVDGIMASVFWEDSSGNVQYRTSGPVSLASVGDWNSLNLGFTSGSALLPTGAATAGETFHVELHAFGAQGGVLYLDNIVLAGNCAPIPEPSGALLIAAAGMAVILRRRTRQR